MEGDVNTLRADWSEPIPVRFGVGRVQELPSLCRHHGMERPLLVTDPGVAGLGILRQVLSSCAGQGIEVAVFSDIRSNPTLRHAEAGLSAYKAGRHDGLVAFGGGSAIDVAKVVGLMATGLNDPWRAEVDDAMAAVPTPTPPPPLIAVPTTAGSGAEVRSTAVITDPETRQRRVLRHPALMPAVAILDPVLTIDLPPNLTAATGMNALTHNLEAFCAPGFDPAAEGIAAEGVRLVRANLGNAYRNGHDLMARSMMLAAAALGGIAFRRGLGAVQALTDPIAALTNAHHGLATAVLTPYVLVHNRPAVEGRIDRLAAYVGLEKGGFEGFLHCLLSLRQELGIPHTLRGLGLDEARVRPLVAAALADPFAATNPVPLTEEGVSGIYMNALEGKLP